MDVRAIHETVYLLRVLTDGPPVADAEALGYVVDPPEDTVDYVGQVLFSETRPLDAAAAARLLAEMGVPDAAFAP
jgi:hypothetical protein